MKVAIYIQDGDTQFVLTPESDWERNAVQGILKRHDSNRQPTFWSGSFYRCQGGWMRQGESDESLMIGFKQ